MASSRAREDPIAIAQDTGLPSRRLLLAAPAATWLAACARRRDPDRLRFWAQDAEGENAKYILPAFERGSGVPVDSQWLAWTAAHEKLLTAFAGGSLPDVMMIARGWVTEFATIGAIAPLPADRAALLADQFDGAVRDMRVGGREYGVPWTVDAQVQYYRRDLLAAVGYDAPPPLWAAWKEMLRAIKRRAPDRYAILLQLNWPEHLANFAVQCDAPLLRDDQTRGDFRSPEFRAALAFYKSLFDEGLAPIASGTDAPDPTAELARGYVAVYPAGAWTGADIRRRAAMPADHWAIARMPSPNGTRRSIVAGAVLAVAHDAANPAHAWDLVRFLTDPAIQAKFHDLAGNFPSRPSAWTSPMLADALGAAVRVAAVTPTVPEWERITGEVQVIAERMVRGRLTVDQAAAAMDVRADALLEKRRWLLDRGRIA